ncbi:protein prenyltransferase alpha subunit repeat domain-containing protein [Ditylenchus destructor]|nr:protein prenyltransferase alpha subunit repeat domain-containing protein [Ditylenchus destructor]
MHNVKKTPATDVYDAIAEKKREEKKKIYLELSDKIFSKREKNELDDELLELTGEALKKNPDIYTFWNIRRQVVILKLSQKAEPEQDTSEEKPDESLTKLFNDELDVTKEALFKNPKSYGAWHHRFWICKNHPKPDYKKELELCEKALSIDGRNFHTWDHRRSIAKLANLSDEDELKFSDTMIARNPSNYSAWHYRGVLLPRINPDTTGEGNQKMLINEECLQDEFEKTEQVCAMNSEDQTAWTYCRWLCEVTCPNGIPCVRDGPRKALERLVEVCEELMKIEDDNPWEIIALARAKLFLNGSNEETLQLLKELYEKVKELDPQRKEMYDELLSKFPTKSQKML